MMSQTCLFRLPGIPNTEDVLASLHLVNGFEKIYLPESIIDHESNHRNMDILEEMSFVEKISKNKIDKSKAEAEVLLLSIGISQTVCSRYPNEFYENLKEVLTQWLISKHLNSDISVLDPSSLFDAINVVAYEYAGMIPVDAAKEMVAWFYSNMAIQRPEAKFFQVKYRELGLKQFLEKEVLPKTVALRNELAVVKSKRDGGKKVVQIREHIAEAHKFAKANWTDSVSIMSGALISATVNPLTSISTSIGAINFIKKFLNEMEKIKNPRFSFERLYEYKPIGPHAGVAGLNFDEFWVEARSGRLLGHNPMYCRCHK